MIVQNQCLKTYSKELKLQIVNQHLIENKHMRSIARESDISYGNIKRWVRKFKAYGEAGLNDTRGLHTKHRLGNRKKAKTFTSELAKLQYEVIMLREENQLLKKQKELRNLQRK